MNEILCDKIKKAFEGVKLGNGIGLQQAEAIDNYDDALTCARYREGDEKDDWSRIPVDELNRCFSSLSFFDAEGMRFHLPAYLLADLKGTYKFDVVHTLTHLNDLQQFSLFSVAQRKVVREFLFHVRDKSEHEFDRPHIIRALRDYWVD